MPVHPVLTADFVFNPKLTIWNFSLKSYVVLLLFIVTMELADGRDIMYNTVISNELPNKTHNKLTRFIKTSFVVNKENKY